MSCFYCNSLFHSSQNCDIYSTDESRKEFLVKNKICEKCLQPSTSHNTSTASACLADPKCYICFSKNHLTVVCKQKRSFEPFMPRIDQTLHSRFFQTLNPIDKYSMAFSSPKYIHFFKQPKGIDVTRNIKEYEIMNYMGKDVAVIPLLVFNTELPPYWSNMLATNTLSIKPKAISLANFKYFSVKLLFQLLSPITKELICDSVSFDSAFHDLEVIKKDVILDLNELLISNQPTQSGFEELFNFKVLSIKSKTIRLWNNSMFSTRTFYELLSYRTTNLRLYNVQFDSTVKFSEILWKIPNIEEIELKDTNIEIENSWPDDLLKCDAGRNLKYLGIHLDNYDFDFGKLVQFMKSKKGTRLFIYLNIIQKENAQKMFSPTLPEKINTHFVKFKDDYCNPFLCITHNLYKDYFRYALA